MSESAIVKVKASDELASVIDRILTSSARMIFLIIEDDAFVAQNVLNFRLIKREAESVDKDIVVITPNHRIQSLASKALIRVKDELDEVHPEVKTKKQYTREVADIIHPSKISKQRESLTMDLRNLRTGSVLEKNLVDPKEQERKEEKRISPQEEVPKSADSEEGIAEDKEEVSPKINYEPDIDEGGKKKKFVPKFNKSTLKNFSFLSKLKKILGKKPLYTAIALFSVVVIIVVGYLFIAVLPKATVVLNPYSTKDKITFSLVADSNISSGDYAKGVIPSQILEEKKEETFKYKATGTAQLEDRAEGTIRIFNEFSSSPQTLVANTRLMSSEGKLFRIIETVVVPGAKIDGGKIMPSSVSLNIRANEAGKEYNIGATTFSIPGFKGDPRFLAFYGKSEEPMRGGYRGTATIVTSEDIENAKKKIEEEFLPSLYRNLEDKIPQSLFILEDATELKIESLEIDAKVGEPKEEFSVKFVGIAQAFLITQEDINNSIAYYFINSTQYSKDFELSENRKIEYTVKEIDFIKGYSEFSLSVDQVFNRIVDAEQILKDVRGKNEVEVRRILSKNETLSRAQVRFWPFWVKSVPENLEDIEIEIEYINDSS